MNACCALRMSASLWTFSIDLKNATIASDTVGRYTIQSEMVLQTRCVAVGALGICITAHGLFATGNYPYL